MARQVVWAARAQRDRKEILKYWILRNQSNLYSKKQLTIQSRIIADYRPPIYWKANIDGKYSG